jgi:hypothetical protein
MNIGFAKWGEACSAVAHGCAMIEHPGAAEPEIRNPKLEVRNKSELPGMGQWRNGKPLRFFAGCEHCRLLQGEGGKEEELEGRGITG